MFVREISYYDWYLIDSVFDGVRLCAVCAVLVNECVEAPLVMDALEIKRYLRKVSVNTRTIVDTVSDSRQRV